MKTTLNKIRAESPCTEGWTKLLQHLGKTKADDEPLSILTVLESNGLDDAIWCLRAVEGRDKEIRLFAVWCARQVQHLMTDPRSVAALDVAEKFAHGLATEAELKEAYDAAYAADSVARPWAYAAARAAAYAAAYASAEAAYASPVASASAYAAASAASAAYAAAKEAQTEELLHICKEMENK
jgi:hypothetical protein